MSCLENLATGEYQPPRKALSEVKKENTSHNVTKENIVVDISSLTAPSQPRTTNECKTVIKEVYIYQQHRFFLDYLSSKFAAPSVDQMETIAWQIGVPYVYVEEWFINRLGILSQQQPNYPPFIKCLLCNGTYSFSSRILESHFLAVEHLRLLWKHIMYLDDQKPVWSKILNQTNNLRDSGLTIRSYGSGLAIARIEDLTSSQSQRSSSVEHAYSKAYNKNLPTFQELDLLLSFHELDKEDSNKDEISLAPDNVNPNVNITQTVKSTNDQKNETFASGSHASVCNIRKKSSVNLRAERKLISKASHRRKKSNQPLQKLVGKMIINNSIQANLKKLKCKNNANDNNVETHIKNLQKCSDISPKITSSDKIVETATKNDANDIINRAENLQINQILCGDSENDVSLNEVNDEIDLKNISQHNIQNSDEQTKNSELRESFETRNDQEQDDKKYDLDYAGNLALLLENEPVDDLSIIDINEIKEELDPEIKVEEVWEEEEIHTYLEPAEYDEFQIYPIHKKLDSDILSAETANDAPKERSSKLKCKMFLHQFRKVVRHTVRTKNSTKTTVHRQNSPKKNSKKRKFTRMSDKLRRKDLLSGLKTQLIEKIASLNATKNNCDRPDDSLSESHTNTNKNMNDVVEIKLEDLEDLSSNISSDATLDIIDNQNILSNETGKNQVPEATAAQSIPKSTEAFKIITNETKVENEAKYNYTEIDSTVNIENPLDETSASHAKIDDKQLILSGEDFEKTSNHLNKFEGWIEPKIEVDENNDTLSGYTFDSIDVNMPVLVKQTLPVHQNKKANKDMGIPILDKEMPNNTLNIRPDINLITERLYVNYAKCNKIIFKSKQYLQKKKISHKKEKISRGNDTTSKSTRLQALIGRLTQKLKYSFTPKLSINDQNTLHVIKKGRGRPGKNKNKQKLKNTINSKLTNFIGNDTYAIKDRPKKIKPKKNNIVSVLKRPVGRPKNIKLPFTKPSKLTSNNENDNCVVKSGSGRPKTIKLQTDINKIVPVLKRAVGRPKTTGPNMPKLTDQTNITENKEVLKLLSVSLESNLEPRGRLKKAEIKTDINKIAPLLKRAVGRPKTTRPTIPTLVDQVNNTDNKEVLQLLRGNLESNLESKEITTELPTLKKDGTENKDTENCSIYKIKSESQTRELTVRLSKQNPNPAGLMRDITYLTKPDHKTAIEKPNEFKELVIKINKLNLPTDLKNNLNKKCKPFNKKLYNKNYYYKQRYITRKGGKKKRINKNILICHKCCFKCNDRYLFKNHIMWCGSIWKSTDNTLSFDEEKVLVINLEKTDITRFELALNKPFKKEIVLCEDASDKISLDKILEKDINWNKDATTIRKQVINKTNSECSEGRELVVNLTRLNKAYKMFQCKYCKLLEFKEEILTSHARQCLKNPGADCNTTYKDKSYVKVYKCLYCSHTRETMIEIERHLKFHTKKSSYKCPHCSYSVWSKNYLSRHVKKCHADKEVSDIPMYKCKMCNSRTRNKKAFLKHEENHKKNAMKCHLCSYSTNLKCSMIRHQKSHRSNKIKKDVSDGSNVGKIKCKHCNFTTHAAKKLKRHQITHLGPEDIAYFFQCRFCPFRHERKDALQRHEKNHEEGQSGEKCPHCTYRGRLFKHLPLHDENLERSLKLTSLKQCPYCPFKAWKISSWKRHCSTHQKQKDANNLGMLSCPLCPYKTCRKYLLKEHLDRHKATKGEKCPHCSYTVSRLTECHLRIHYNEH